MLAIDEDGTATEGIPELDSPVKIGGGDSCVIRRPGDGENSILRSTGVNMLAAEWLPDLHSAIAVIPAGGDVATTGTPGDAAYKAHMPAIRRDDAACANLPDMDNTSGTT